MPTKKNTPDLVQGRARRALQVGSLTTSVGSGYLWHALKRPFQSATKREQELLDLHLRSALRIVERSRELRGAFMKLVQMLSMRGDLFPPEVLNILSVVQSSVPPMDYELIRTQVKKELGKYPEQLFKVFVPQAFAAASLGQVHRAVLRSGEEVVVKVQYPGVDQTVEQDLKNLQALLHVFTLIARDVLRQKFDASEIYQEMEERLKEELDYIHEANNIALFQRLFADDAEVIIPRVYPDFSSRRVLTMEYIDGYKFQEVLAPGVEQSLKDWIAIKYFTITWRQIFEFGVLHTDPHPGNYLVTYHPKLAMLDFGSVRIFPEEIRRSYHLLAKAILERDEETMARCFVLLGYLDPGDDPAPLVRVMYILFEPVLEDRLYDPRDFDSVSKTVEVAAIGLENRIFNAPGHRLFLVRALLGLDSYVHQFGTVTNWHRLFRECVERVQEARPARSVSKPVRR
ncbi:MAG: AarF/ABC1/UbiB kinase family protein [Candidatus Binatia bacterium]|nr:AarF/ABC1/UbiB kinase family protein [Candidatus Binatia bacterium]